MPLSHGIAVLTRSRVSPGARFCSSGPARGGFFCVLGPGGVLGEALGGHVWPSGWPKGAILATVGGQSGPFGAHWWPNVGKKWKTGDNLR